MKFYDAFHGVGGFRYGLEQAGMTCVGGCEIDKYACQAYGVINDEDCRPTDIRTVDPFRLSDFDVFVGGFPCQDLSVAGKRKGFDGERSVLFFEILRICEVKRPTYILLENVTGLFSHNNGETFGTVLQSLDELGYDAEWQVHNSAAYVPQNRERVFIIGHLRGRSTRTVFPFGSEDGNIAEITDSVNDERKLITKQDNRLQIREIANCLDANYFKGLDCHQQRTGVLQPVEIKEITCINPRKEDGTQTYQQDRVYQTNGIMTTLSAELAGRFNITQGYRIRKLTPLECFRLQSYPDWWLHKLKEAGISDSQLYKMAGNGVTSEVARRIGIRLMNGA